MKTVALILLYLSLPLLLFWWGWFAWWVALPSTLALLYFFFAFWQTYAVSLRFSLPHKALIPLWSCLLLALVWTYLAGVGGFRPQHFDYYKHNLIFNNLIRHGPPVRYADGSYLCYSLAYYLPPAWVARWTGGLPYVHYVIFGWTWLGLGLVFTLLSRLNGWKMILLFLFFNSPEAILYIYDAAKAPDFLLFLKDLWSTDHTIELLQSPGGLLFHSHVESFIATPQHALSAWLATGILLTVWKNSAARPFVILPFALVALLLYWSPFVAVGLLPLALYVFWDQKTPLPFSIPHVLRTLVFVVLLTFPVLIFYAGHVPVTSANGGWWNFLKTPKDVVFLVIFVGLEIGIWGFFIGNAFKNRDLPKRDLGLLLCALLTLLAAALYRYGPLNDFARRASLPAMLVICWGISTLSFRKPMLMVTLMLCVLLPLKQQLRWFSARPYTPIVNKTIPSFTPYPIHYLGHFHRASFDAATQYLGRADAWYLRYFAPDGPPKPKEVTRAFYYWKSTFQLTDYEKHALQRYAVTRLYVKFFDVDWDMATRRAVPKAAIHFAETPTVEMIPTVFITNRTLEKLSWGGVDELAGKIVAKIDNLTPAPLLKKGEGESEVQIDCDWSLATRAKYFRLLNQLKKKLPDGTRLSATIRLHQIKFYRTTGVPPVERGMLMYYNMDDWKNPKTENSILDLTVAGRYADYVSDYPLPLDLVLPVFRWAVVYRNGRFLRFVNHLTHQQLSTHSLFQKSTLPNAYIVRQNGTFVGIPVRRGDLFRVEESTVENLKISTQTLAQEIQNTKATFALYHLDSLNLTYYAVPNARVFLPERKEVDDPIQQIFQTFR
ncbi:hypothetical protein [Runella slithyformis]|uniref:Uncharacterized protein n=1 Tax=Runella slithyformis (strain ATCC 29530 / DSM 19594 / LMG 11500 / NCIMB 11436 / LSU 4) TaxID=761193 RepID=A0A7U3ZQN1_RUNSL|nr:hypothetical protein [Runella slithyformis]AEI51589.1 hypothetical protein Runsl_5292 [Runella slithyformis DSM 19594]